ncbi:f-box and wd repeat domain-containing 7 [Anaeramoeba ignava]|uniref:F-box and wd repeat domain-containing 7 n=1 Tax=Anaeramoeba ignava TaxID=1746090 RepID=A0A9Q0LFR7_ANAIG|nr:f-box and wd repeat domain-containing 7 [Anaeramoeba ignava]
MGNKNSQKNFKINQETMGNFSQLPEELIIYIFQFLDDQNLIKLSSVSRTFNEISNDPYVWKLLFKSHNPHLENVPVPPPSLRSWKKYYIFRTIWKQKWFKQKYRQPANIRYQPGVNGAKFTGIDQYATCNWDGTVKLWEISKKRKVLTLPTPHTGPIWSLDVNKQRTQLVSGGKDQEIHLYNLPSHKKFQQLYDQTQKRSAKINLDHINNHINNHNNEANEEERKDEFNLVPVVFKGHHGPVACMKLDEEKIISGSYDTDVRIWDITTHKTKGIIHHSDSIWALDYVGDRLITGSRDTALRWWNIQTEKEVDLLVGHERPISTLQYDGDIIISGGYDNTCRVWDLRSSKRCIDVLRGHQSTVSYLQFDSDVLVTSSFDSTIKVWDRRKLSAGPVHTFKEFERNTWVLSVEFRDGVLLATSNAGEAKVLDFRTKEMLEVENSEMLWKWQN